VGEPFNERKLFTDSRNQKALPEEELSRGKTYTIDENAAGGSY
jgi:hypothetical protein